MKNSGWPIWVGQYGLKYGCLVDLCEARARSFDAIERDLSGVVCLDHVVFRYVFLVAHISQSKTLFYPNTHVNQTTILKLT